MKKHYTPFNKCVFRTPAYDFSMRDKLTGNLSDGFREALYLASLDFYNEKIKNFNSDKTDDKTKQSLYKYAYRACSRCTPFGLFAGCSVAEISDKTDIILEDSSKNKRITRLDMSYMCALVQYIEAQKEIRKQLTYFPNDSIYLAGGAFRFIEYHYKGVNRLHDISKLDFSETLNDILTFTAAGKHYNKVIDYLIDEDTTKEEAEEFTEELINMQFLKSEFELSVTGDDALEVLIRKLRRLKDTDTIITPLETISALLKQINSSEIGTTTAIYDEIAEELKKLGIQYDSKYLFQTDLFKPVVAGNISQKIIGEISDAITFMNKLYFYPLSGSFGEFTRKFLERYEDKEVSLLEALDTEMGLGSIYTGSTDGNELLKGVRFNNAQQQSGGSDVSPLTGYILKKYIDCIKAGADTIELTDDDLTKTAKANWQTTPPTMSVMCSIIKDDGENSLIHLKNYGGCCAANLLGRFCHLDHEIEALTKAITQKEKEYYKDCIVAEIVHLPADRMGNILFRPVLREYEIHYLARPAVDEEFRIPISDIYVSVKEGGKILLRSKKLNKRILPRLTTAHNYSHGSPVYRFICELQYQELGGVSIFGWADLFNTLDFKPRVVYKNCILSRRQWKILMTDFEETEQKDFDKFKEKLIKIREQKSIPRYMIIPESDNELLIDFDENVGVHVFHAYLKSKKGVWVEEFLFDEDDACVKDEKGKSYCNEFLLLFHKTQ